EKRLLLSSFEQLFRNLLCRDPVVTAVHCGNLMSIVIVDDLVFLVFFLHDLLLPVLCLFLTVLTIPQVTSFRKYFFALSFKRHPNNTHRSVCACHSCAEPLPLLPSG